jgi:hypothetical protein
MQYKARQVPRIWRVQFRGLHTCRMTLILAPIQVMWFGQRLKSEKSKIKLRRIVT